MQKKVWYYEKWVGRHASFPPRRSDKKEKLKKNRGGLEFGKQCDEHAQTVNAF